MLFAHPSTKWLPMYNAHGFGRIQAMKAWGHFKGHQAKGPTVTSALSKRGNWSKEAREPLRRGTESGGKNGSGKTNKSGGAASKLDFYWRGSACVGLKAEQKPHQALLGCRVIAFERKAQGVDRGLPPNPEAAGLRGVGQDWNVRTQMFIYFGFFKIYLVGFCSYVYHLYS